MASAKFITAVVAVLILTAAARAEGPMLDEIARKLIEGRTIDPSKTAAFYAPLQQKGPYAGVRVEGDVKYGPASSPTSSGGLTTPANNQRPIGTTQAAYSNQQVIASALISGDASYIWNSQGCGFLKGSGPMVLSR